MTAAALPQVTANKEGWAQSQSYELTYWKEQWPWRDQPVDELQRRRHEVAKWFLQLMGFRAETANEFAGFSGRILEVGSGPIGFFELIKGCEVLAIDPLMRAYADNLPFSLIGTRGCTTYIAESIVEQATDFDFVICSNVLDHTADWIETIEQCVARLKPEGDLLLYTDSRGVPSLGHTQVFSPDQLRRVLRLAGAKQFVVDVTETGRNQHCDFTNAVRARF
jgi:SAM-dependent methyltransferase